MNSVERQMNTRVATAKTVVLVVTDRSSFGLALEKHLAAYGYGVTIVRTLHDVRHAAHQMVPALILVDRDRVTSCLSAMLDTIRNTSAFFCTPVMTVSEPHRAFSPEDCVIDLEVGCDACLCNLTWRQIVAHVRGIIRRAQRVSEQRPILSVGSLRMDVGRHEVWLADQPVNLTPREFTVLKQFMERPGLVLPREEILTRVWGDDYAMDEHALDVYVHALRSKLPVAPPTPGAILTIRGIGYKLIGG